jgi:hypothetical protein
MKYMGIKVLCGAVTAVSILGGLPARADPPAANGGDPPQRAGFHHLRRSLHELRNPGKPPERPGQPQAGELSDDERRALRRDLERADREIYQK